MYKIEKYGSKRRYHRAYFVEGPSPENEHIL